MRRRISLILVAASVLVLARGQFLTSNPVLLFSNLPVTSALAVPIVLLKTFYRAAPADRPTNGTGEPSEPAPPPPPEGQNTWVAIQPSHAVADGLSADAYTLAGPPTIDVSTIDAVLSRYHSPMAGSGQEIYNLGMQYGIDPAFCLAFFVHESAAGTRGEAVATHSMGNIRAEPHEPSLDGFRLYATWNQSVRDWYRLISTVYMGQWHLNTVSQIVPVYAPASDDNDVLAYIDDVEALVVAWRAQTAPPPNQLTHR